MAADYSEGFSAESGEFLVEIIEGKTGAVASSAFQGKRGEALEKLLDILAEQIVADYLREQGQTAIVERNLGGLKGE